MLLSTMARYYPWWIVAKPGHEITVGDIVRIVNDVDPDDDDTASNSELGVKVVGPLWNEIENNILRWFDDISVADLCDMASRRGIEPVGMIRKIAV